MPAVREVSACRLQGQVDYSPHSCARCGMSRRPPQRVLGWAWRLDSGYCVRAASSCASDQQPEYGSDFAYESGHTAHDADHPADDGCGVLRLEDGADERGDIED